MGRIAKILSFVRRNVDGIRTTDVKVDPGGGANITCVHAHTPGDDSSPLGIDYAVIQGIQGTGKEAAVGYLDTVNAPKSAPGEKRIYARDGNGVPVNEVHLKSDGEIVIKNITGGAAITVNPAGNITVSALTVNLADVAGKRLANEDFVNLIFNAHTHAAGPVPDVPGGAVHMTVKTRAS